ncbi:SRPBCC family protein [Dryocola sp. BD586]|uniref:SRPBCC family protein n=1 Tax=Dryocola sp. BD586 TaxID=3133271 RepID=UPI003F50B90F
MNNHNAKELVFEYHFKEAPEKVWRAITIPEYREQWLPSANLSNPEPVSFIPNKEVSYQMKDNEPPYLESEVRFLIGPNGNGGSILTIHHVLIDERLKTLSAPAANDDTITSMKAA